jgi:hypothetical protein
MTTNDRFLKRLETMRERNARKIERLALLAALARLDKRGMTFGDFVRAVARRDLVWDTLVNTQVTQVARALMPKTVAAKKKRKKAQNSY